MNKLLIGIAAAAAIIALPFVAEAHTPAVTATCQGVSVELVSYEGPASNNTVTITIGNTPQIISFANSYLNGFPVPQNGATTPWSVVINANINTGDKTAYDKTFSGTVGPCGTATTTTSTTTTTTVAPTQQTVPTTAPATTRVPGETCLMPDGTRVPQGSYVHTPAGPGSVLASGMPCGPVPSTFPPCDEGFEADGVTCAGPAIPPLDPTTTTQPSTSGTELPVVAPTTTIPLAPMLPSTGSETDMILYIACILLPLGYLTVRIARRS